jgi:hypothetical protein
MSPSENPGVHIPASLKCSVDGTLGRRANLLSTTATLVLRRLTRPEEEAVVCWVGEAARPRVGPFGGTEAFEDDGLRW